MLSSFYEDYIYEYSLSQASVFLIFVYLVSLVVWVLEFRSRGDNFGVLTLYVFL